MRAGRRRPRWRSDGDARRNGTRRLARPPAPAPTSLTMAAGRRGTRPRSPPRRQSTASWDNDAERAAAVSTAKILRVPPATLVGALRAGLDANPFNAVATIVFALAIVHTFAAARFTELAHRLQRRRDRHRLRRPAGESP